MPIGCGVNQLLTGRKNRNHLVVTLLQQSLHKSNAMH